MNMQADHSMVESSVRVEAADGKYVAEFLTQSSSWMTGSIIGRQFADDDERRDYISQVMAAIEVVADDERLLSTCTDGRRRVKLEDGAPVPVREQLVGTDTMAAFVAAEALGAHFYGSDLYSPAEVRIRKVVQHLLDNGYQPTAHIACGAAGGFTTVINRSTQFIKDASYIERLKVLLGETYSDTLHHLIVGSYQSRLVSGAYETYEDGLVASVVRQMVGPQAVEYYDDDGRGVRGHREQVIVYLAPELQGQAINPNKLIEASGNQVFGVNAGRAQAIAQVMSGGQENGIEYLTARLAIEDFSCAGHGTLAADMETVIVRPAA
jgi:hypothetical protein